MQIIPKNAKKIKIENSTIEFFEDLKENHKNYYFDTSSCAVPEPMINAMLGLQLIANTNNKLIMINHCIPNGLFPKIDKSFDFKINEKEELFIIEFTYKKDSKQDIDYKDNQCSG